MQSATVSVRKPFRRPQVEVQRYSDGTYDFIRGGRILTFADMAAAMPGEQAKPATAADMADAAFDQSIIDGLAAYGVRIQPGSPVAQSRDDLVKLADFIMALPSIKNGAAPDAANNGSPMLAGSPFGAQPSQQFADAGKRISGGQNEVRKRALLAMSETGRKALKRSKSA